MVSRSKFDAIKLNEVDAMNGNQSRLGTSGKETINGALERFTAEAAPAATIAEVGGKEIE